MVVRYMEIFLVRYMSNAIDVNYHVYIIIILSTNYMAYMLLKEIVGYK